MKKEDKKEGGDEIEKLFVFGGAGSLHGSQTHEHILI